ncbi:MAG: tetratricopeptide repeat protein [Leptolyngbyaceae cyanobacterium SM1_1_3]|nr:tetratricopeptide repeat protein [Leptolyngbyaceae cyanobacterium SM1_1_3]
MGGWPTASCSSTKRRFQSFDKAVASQPNDAVAWLNRGLALSELEKFEEALTSFDRATRFNPNSPKAWDNRGYVLMKLGRDSEAIRSFDKALETDANYDKALYNKAICYAMQREVDMALEHLQQSIRLEPSYREEAKVEPAFDTLWEDDWFKDLVRR